MDMMQKYAADAAKRSIRQYCQPRCYEFTCLGETSCGRAALI